MNIYFMIFNIPYWYLNYTSVLISSNFYHQQQLLDIIGLEEAFILYLESILDRNNNIS